MVPQTELTLLEYYIIHKIVQMLIVYEYGYAMEVYVIDSKGKRGFLDLYDYTTNQYYEVKHAQCDIADTKDQMDRYEESTIKSWMFKEYAYQGSPDKGTNMGISGSFTFGDYRVEYSTVDLGLIYYQIFSTGTGSPVFAYDTILLENKKEKTQAWIAAGCFLFLGGAGKARQRSYGNNRVFDLGFS